jgi:hypothetical protein
MVLSSCVRGRLYHLDFCRWAFYMLQMMHLRIECARLRYSLFANSQY